MPDPATLTPLSAPLQEIEARIQAGDHALALERILAAGKDPLEPAEQVLLHHFHGLALFHLGRSPEAGNRFRRGLQLAESLGDVTGQARALEQLGGLHHHERRLQEALACLEQALKLWKREGDQVGEARSYRNLGNVLSDLDRPQPAWQAYQASRELFRELELPDEVAPAVIHAASLTYQQQGRQAAIEEYRKALEEEGCRHYLVLNNYGFLLILEGRTEEARQHLERAGEDVVRRGGPPDDVALVHLNLGVLEALSEALEPALDRLGQAAALLADHPEARATEILLQANRPYLEQGFHPYLLVDNGQKLALAHLNRATVLAWQGRFEEAAAEGRRGVEADRGAPYPLLSLGWILLAGGDPRGATQAFRRAVGMDPQNPEFRRALHLVNPWADARTGRNEPCPCGSDKKFKKCHGAD